MFTILVLTRIWKDKSWLIRVEICAGVKKCNDHQYMWTYCVPIHFWISCFFECIHLPMPGSNMLFGFFLFLLFILSFLFVCQHFYITWITSLYILLHMTCVDFFLYYMLIGISFGHHLYSVFYGRVIKGTKIWVIIKRIFQYIGEIDTQNK